MVEDEVIKKELEVKKEELRSGGKNLGDKEKRAKEVMEEDERKEDVRDKTEGKVEGAGSGGRGGRL